MSEQEILEQRLAALEAENGRLRAAIEELHAQFAALGDAHELPFAPGAAQAISRRRALATLGGVAAAAGVAATAGALANAPDARAADGEAILMGQSNTTSHQTTITDDGTVSHPATLSGVATGGATGLAGSSSSGAGVSGISSTGTGIVGSCGQYDLVLNGSGHIFFGTNTTYDGPPPGGTYGEATVDNLGRPWYHTPANLLSEEFQWARPGLVPYVVAESFGGARIQGGAMNFLPSPVRMIGAGSPPGVSLAKNTHTNFILAGSAGIPTNATAVFGNATVYGASGSGFVTLTPIGGTASTSSLNFTATDQPLSNFVAVALSFGTEPPGGITVVVSNNFNVKFIFDVVGFCL